MQRLYPEKPRESISLGPAWQICFMQKQRCQGPSFLNAKKLESMRNEMVFSRTNILNGQRNSRTRIPKDGHQTYQGLRRLW